MEQLDALHTEDKRRVLDFSRTLAARKLSANMGGSLLAFAGQFSKDDLAEMSQAINAECERVDC